MASDVRSDVWGACASDATIRLRVRAEIATREPGARIVDEVAVMASRIDVFAIGERLSGYEIKSAADSLTRLPQQVRDYARVCDHCVLVATMRHVDRARAQIPQWWGITAAFPDGPGVALTVLRTPEGNPAVDARALAGLLWRDELLAVLDDLGAARGWRSRSRYDLQGRLAGVCSLKDLNGHVRTRLCARTGWRDEHGRSVLGVA